MKYFFTKFSLSGYSNILLVEEGFECMCKILSKKRKTGRGGVSDAAKKGLIIYLNGT